MFRDIVMVAGKDAEAHALGSEVQSGGLTRLECGGRSMNRKPPPLEALENVIPDRWNLLLRRPTACISSRSVLASSGHPFSYQPSIYLYLAQHEVDFMGPRYHYSTGKRCSRR